MAHLHYRTADKHTFFSTGKWVFPKVCSHSKPLTAAQISTQSSTTTTCSNGSTMSGRDTDHQSSCEQEAVSLDFGCKSCHQTASTGTHILQTVSEDPSSNASGNDCMQQAAIHELSAEDRANKQFETREVHVEIHSEPSPVPNVFQSWQKTAKQQVTKYGVNRADELKSIDSDVDLQMGGLHLDDDKSRTLLSEAKIKPNLEICHASSALHIQPAVTPANPPVVIPVQLPFNKGSTSTTTDKAPPLQQVSTVSQERLSIGGKLLRRVSGGGVSIPGGRVVTERSSLNYYHIQYFV